MECARVAERAKVNERENEKGRLFVADDNVATSERKGALAKKQRLEEGGEDRRRRVKE